MKHTTSVEYPDELGGLEWSRKEQEPVSLGIAQFLPEKMMARITEEMKEQMAQKIAQSFASRLLDSSAIPLQLHFTQIPKPELSGVEYVAIVDTVFRPLLLPKALQLQKSNESLLIYLSRPWWQLVRDILLGRMRRFVARHQGGI